jgi:hypothetical protein
MKDAGRGAAWGLVMATAAILCGPRPAHAQSCQPPIGSRPNAYQTGDPPEGIRVTNRTNRNIIALWKAAGCVGVKDGHTTVCESKTVAPGHSADYKFPFYTSNRSASATCVAPRWFGNHGAQPSTNELDIVWKSTESNCEWETLKPWQLHESKTESVIGSGWNFRIITGGYDGVFYALSWNNQLFWYRRAGTPESWLPRKQIGLSTKWGDFLTVFGGHRKNGHNVLYAIDKAHDMWIFEHDDPEGGADTWTAPMKIGGGWDFKHVWGGHEGVIYALDNNDKLRWYKNVGRNGATKASWYEGGAKFLTIPQGVSALELKTAFGGKNGVFYTFYDKKLRKIEHTGWTNGADSLQPVSDVTFANSVFAERLKAAACVTAGGNGAQFYAVGFP